MSKIILSLLLLLLAVPQFCAADTVTVGFEKLESVCGSNYTNCDVQASDPYYNLGLQFVNGIIQSDLYLPGSSSQSVFPFGSHYLNIAGSNPTGSTTATWNFIDPWQHTARTVYTVSFLVLGKNGDVISGQRGSGVVPGTPALTQDQIDNGVPEQPNVRNCNNQAECVGFLGGFNVFAYNGLTPIDYAVVEPVFEGQAGYDTYGQDFANIRVTISSYTGFDRLVFTTTPTSSTQNGMTEAWGMIAIDQITFDHAVPEPGTFALIGLAGAGLIAWRRRQQAAKA